MNEGLPSNHKAGFVNIIGKPNAGKSTLMNALVGEKLAIITEKAQTTRHRIMGIVNRDAFQIVFSDTPGFIEPKYKMQEAMMHFVNLALEDADMVLLMIDATDQRVDEQLGEKINLIKVPVVVLLNKVDQIEKKEVQPLLHKWQGLVKPAQAIPISAIGGYNINKVVDVILQYLPVAPPFYPKDQLTDKPSKFFVEETVREKIMLLYEQEIPYSVEVAVDSFKEEENIIRIHAIIFVNRKTQKPIIIGKNGKMIKQLGILARKDIEEFFGKKVFLELYVKVKENWRDSEHWLKLFGY